METPFFPITYIIIGITVIFSMLGFNNPELFHRFKHWPYAEERRGEYIRWLTGGFLHADWMHLLFNMLTLYGFGLFVESEFARLFPGFGPVMYVVFYLLAILAASAATFYRHRTNPGFASIGASGAVAAVLFAAILLEPGLELRLFFIPIDIPGFIFGAIYLWYSSYAANRLNDNIDHIAHFYGSVFGFVFPLIFHPSLFLRFVEGLQAWFANVFG
jgi:membrane associated rhomboid family serine protease